jgi:protein gp37
MSDGSKIEWTDATWPIVQGCDPVSPGCVNCYAVPLLWRLAHNPSRKISEPIKGLTEVHTNAAGKRIVRFSGKVALREDRLDWPLKWREPRMIFVPSHGDLFHEDVPDEFIDRAFAVMALCPQHTFQVLTKRSGRMRHYLRHAWGRGPAEDEGWPDCAYWRVSAAAALEHPQLFEQSGIGGCDWWPLPNVWLGVSAERQQEADARIPDLLATPAAVWFVSLEPLLEPIDLTSIQGHYRMAPDYRDRDGTRERMNVLNGSDRREHLRTDGTWNHRRLDDPDGDPCFTGNCNPRLDWVIVGGESGRHARSMHIDWAHAIVAQCQAANVPVFVKQLGARPTWQHSGAPFPIHHTKGADMSEWPPELRVREMPHR